MDKSRLAISQVTTKNWSLSQELAEYTDSGVVAIALWRDKLDLMGTEEALRLVKERPLKVSSISDSGYFLAKTRSQAERAIADVNEALDLARAVSALSMVLITGQGGSVFRSPEQDQEIVIDSLREVAPVAEDYGIKLAIEAVNDKRYPGLTFLNSIPSTVALLDDIGSDAVGLCFDFDHLWEEPNLWEHLSQIQGRIFAVHICDMPANPRPPFDRQVLGDGIIPLAELVHAIEDTGYTGYYDLEIFSLDLWNADYATLIRRCQEAWVSL